MSKFKQYPATFWVSNILEIFERMAWYGFYSLSSLYITGSVADGCLGFTSEQRGFLQGVVTFILYLLPVLMGAIVERFGHKKMLATAFIVLAPSYYLLGAVTNFWGFFTVFLLVAIGAAMFKPALMGSIAKTTTEKTASFGWGIFYMVVNIGGFVGPLIAGILRNWDWKWIFSASAGWIVLNLILLVLFYKEPKRSIEAGERKTLRGVLNNMVEILGNGRLFLAAFVVIVLTMVMAKGWISSKIAVVLMAVWVIFNLVVDVPLKKKKFSLWIAQPMKLGNWQFVLFLMILSGFWMLYNQIFFTGPEYLRDFCDTGPILLSLGKFFALIGASGLSAKMYELVNTGYQINPEFILNMNPLSIIVFQLFVTWAFLKRKPFVTMMAGIVMTIFGMLFLGLGALKIATGGISITEAAPIIMANGWIVVLGVVVFTLGEMLTAPKSQEYIALIADKDKVSIFMGYYFVSSAFGALFAGLLSGSMYGWLARDLGRPDLMWMSFALFAFMVLIAFLLYNKFVVKKRKKDLPTHDAHMIHAEDGEDVPEIPEME